MRAGQRVHLAPDGTDVGGLASVQTDAFIKDATTHGIALHIVIVTVDQAVLLFQFLRSEVGVCLGIACLEVLAYLFKSFGALLLLQCLLGHIISGLVALVVGLLTQVLVVHLVAVLALHVLAQFLGQLLLKAAHGLDGLVCSFQSCQQVLLAHFLHFAFHHHDVLFGGAHHQVHVGLFKLTESGVDDKLSVDTGHAHFRYRTAKGNIAHRQGC